MSHYKALVKWQLEGSDFLERKYSRAHTWEFDGGISVDASASPSIVPEPWSKPENVDPEEAFVASLSSCHMLFFLDLASRAGFIVESYEDNAVGTLAQNSNGLSAMTHVELRPKVKFSPDQDPSEPEIESLHHRAHDLCFIANSVTTEIIITPQ